MFVFEFLVCCIVIPTMIPTTWSSSAQRIGDNFRKGAGARKEIQSSPVTTGEALGGSLRYCLVRNFFILTRQCRRQTQTQELEAVRIYSEGLLIMSA
jgi:hypothetical protein